MLTGRASRLAEKRVTGFDAGARARIASAAFFQSHPPKVEAASAEPRPSSSSHDRQASGSQQICLVCFVFKVRCHVIPPEKHSIGNENKSFSCPITLPFRVAKEPFGKGNNYSPDQQQRRKRMIDATRAVYNRL